MIAADAWSTGFVLWTAFTVVAVLETVCVFARYHRAQGIRPVPWSTLQRLNSDADKEGEDADTNG